MTKTRNVTLSPRPPGGPWPPGLGSVLHTHAAPQRFPQSLVDGGGGGAGTGSQRGGVCVQGLVLSGQDSRLLRPQHRTDGGSPAPARNSNNAFLFVSDT